MNYLKFPVCLAAALLVACVHEPARDAAAGGAAEAGRVAMQPGGGEAMLLVSLDDGTVIMQTIESSASVCFKLNSETSTTCLLQGAPLVDPATDAVIGYEMIEEQIELIAKTD